MKASKEQLILLIQNNGYIIEKELGKGAFAQVYLATSQKYNQKYALKCINKYTFIGRERDIKAKEFKLALLSSEVQNMKRCSNSDYIMKCYGVFENENFQILVLEYCNKGSLFDLINQRYHLQEEQAVNILQQLICGFAVLHKNKIIHRDLKTQNILIHNNTYKIADLGMSKKVEKLTQCDRGTIVGTRCTMAPEVLKGQGYTSQADIWSLGVIYYEIITGLLPFGSNITKVQIEKTIKNILILKISNQSKDFLKSLFVINPLERLSWLQLYKMYNQRQGIFKDRSKPALTLSYDSNILQETPIHLNPTFIQTETFENKNSKTVIFQSNQKQLQKTMNSIPITQYRLVIKDKMDFILSSLELTNQQFLIDLSILKQNTLIMKIILQNVINPLRKFMIQNRYILVQLSQLVFLMLIYLKICQEEQNSEKYFDYGIGYNPGKYSKTKAISSDVQIFIDETRILYKQIQEIYSSISSQKLRSRFEEGLIRDIQTSCTSFFNKVQNERHYEWMRSTGNTIQQIINAFTQNINSNKKSQLSRVMKKIRDS